MNFTREQFNVLTQWERPMRIAVYSRYLRGIGSAALAQMVGIYNSVAKTPVNVNGNCATCIYDFLVTIGRLYFADAEEWKNLPETTDELKERLTKKQPKKKSTK